MLSVLTKHIIIIIVIIIIKGLQETLGRDGYVYDLDGTDGFTGVYLSPNLWGCTLKIYTAFSM